MINRGNSNLACTMYLTATVPLHEGQCLNRSRVENACIHAGHMAVSALLGVSMIYLTACNDFIHNYGSS